MDKEEYDRIINTYAMRLARLCYLKHYCSCDSIILKIEENLVEMAASKLQEYILAYYSIDSVKQTLTDRIKLIVNSQADFHEMEINIESSITQSLDTLFAL